MARHILSVDVGEALKKHIEKQATAKKFNNSAAYVKAVLRKYTGFKEKDLV